MTFTAPTQCIHGMTSAVLTFATLGVNLEWAELGDSAGLWTPENRTLQIDRLCPMFEQARVIEEFNLLCHGREDETSWVQERPRRPQLRLVPPPR